MEQIITIFKTVTYELQCYPVTVPEKILFIMYTVSLLFIHFTCHEKMLNKE